MINPGTVPVADPQEHLAADNIAVFVDELRHRGIQLVDEPVREPAADRDGRYGYRLPVDVGRRVLVLMPGASLAHVRDDLRATAPCLFVGEPAKAWWWHDALGQVAGGIPAAGWAEQH